jgi:sigma-E factor negative regulatory protein RseC
MANTIQHYGDIESIVGDHITVKIVQTSACSGCSVKGHCSAAESKEKTVDIYSPLASSYDVGERVIVVGAASLGMKAVLLAFVIPFLVLVVTLFVCMSLTGGDELLSSLISFLLLVPYYFAVWAMRDKMKKKFSFTIKPIK